MSKSDTLFGIKHEDFKNWRENHKQEPFTIETLREAVEKIKNLPARSFEPVRYVSFDEWEVIHEMQAEGKLEFGFPKHEYFEEYLRRINEKRKK